MGSIVKKIAFRLDAEPEIGLGHLSRCFKLAQNLLPDFQIGFFTSSTSSSYWPEEKGAWEFSKVEGTDTYPLQKFFGDEPGVLIVDSYRFSNADLAGFVQRLPNVMVLAFDDFAEKFSSPVHGWINFSLTSATYAPPDARRQTSLWGLEYWPEKKAVLSARETSQEKLVLGVTMGGSDPEQQSERILKIVKSREFSSVFKKIVFILGPAFEDVSKFKSLASETSGVEVLHAPSDVAAVFKQVDLMINGGGTTSVELGFLGVPQLLLSLADNQEKTCRFLSDKNFVSFLGVFDALSDSQLGDAILAAAPHHELFRQRAENFAAYLRTKQDASQNSSTFFSELFEHHLSDEFAFSEIEKEYTYETPPRHSFEAAKWATHENMIRRFQLAARTVDWRTTRSWLDVGTGAGDFLLEIEPHSTIERFVGLDISSTMIQMARDRKYSSQNVRFEKTNFTVFKDDSVFDLVTAIGVLQKCGISPFLFFNKAHSLLKTGGQFFFTTKNSGWKKLTSGELEPYAGHKWFSVPDIKSTLEICGFKVLQCQGFLPSENKEVELDNSHSFYVLAEKIR